MNWNAPNQLTIARMGLAIAFFVLLGLYEQGAAAERWLLNCAFGIYVVAGITDVLDGWIARKYDLVSAFGRITDPFVDKVLVVGAFVMLTGSNFALHQPPPPAYAQLPDWFGWLAGDMLSGVQAWMAVVILGREFVVSAIRGYSESQGIKFPAVQAGKIKMFIQSLAICAVLMQIANLPDASWAVIAKVSVVWLAVLVTVLSALAYVKKTRRLLLMGDRPRRERAG
jgi:CDP-diacylglycerol--glycerol-3-phosphate 3-phosphatidyltransferase